VAVKKNSTIFFQALTTLFGMAALILMLWEPHLEGRNVHATLFQIYFQDPFLAFAYIASIPFYVIIYQVFKLLGLVGQNELLRPKSLRIIKYCAMALIGFVLIGEVFILLDNSGEDRAGGIFMGAVVIMFSMSIVAIATRFERLGAKSG
jgi:hypothetical protein